MQHKKLAIMVALVSISNIPTVNAVIRGKNVNMGSNHFTVNDEIIAQETLKIEAKKIDGDGWLEGKNIEITTEDFAFEGQIECAEKCTITTSKPIDCTTFTRGGDGSFEFVVDEQKVKDAFK